MNYTNRKGVDYFLCKGTTKTGKPRYYFARQPKGEAVDAIPEGYEIEESVNGIVSLVKIRPKLIAPEETAAVEAALKRHPTGRNYRISVKYDQIIVYERRGPGAESLVDIFGKFNLFSPEYLRASLQDHLDQSAQFSPIMRFILEDPERRIYRVERWCFLGSIDDWIYAGRSDTIEVLAHKLIPMLGTDSFYDLY